MPHAETIDRDPRLHLQNDARPPTAVSTWSSSTTSTRQVTSSSVNLRPDHHVEFASDAASFLSGSWMKKNKPSAQRSRTAPPVSLNLARISESSSLRRSGSSREASSRPQTSQTLNTYTTASTPSSPGQFAPRRLTPFASFTSLRSNGDMSETKKKNRLLSFRITTPKLSSRSTSPQPSSPGHGPTRLLRRDNEEADVHHRAMEQLPADIKPSAMKLLGIEVHGSMYVQHNGGRGSRSNNGGRGRICVPRETNTPTETRHHDAPQVYAEKEKTMTKDDLLDSTAPANVKPFARRPRPVPLLPPLNDSESEPASIVSPSLPRSPLHDSPQSSSRLPHAQTDAKGSYSPPNQGRPFVHDSPQLSLRPSRQVLSSSPQSSYSSSPQLSSRPSRQRLSPSPQMSSLNSPQLSSRPSRQLMFADPLVYSSNSPQLSTRPSRQSIRGGEEHTGRSHQPQLSSQSSHQSMRSPSTNSFASDSTLRDGMVSPITGQPRPEHPLEAEARIANGCNGSPHINNMDSYFQATARSTEPLRTTFYSDSSEGEGEEDEEANGLRSSGYSLASSQTSYGVASANDPDTKTHPDGVNGRILSPSAQHGIKVSGNVSIRPAPEDNISPSHSKHHQQGSTSSIGSSYSSRYSGASSPGAVRSFSRPFTRPPTSPIDITFDSTSQRLAPPRSNDRSFATAIGVADGQPSMQLEAITEDSPDVSDDDSEPLVNAEQGQMIGHRRHASGSRNFSRPQVISSPMEQASDAENAPRSGRPSAGSIATLIASRTADRLSERPISLAFQRPARPLSLAFEKQSQVSISAASAESVILRILESLDTFADLFVAARLNKGFLAVFKKNELRLMKNALRNMSPAQWELREASPKEIILGAANGKTEYSPSNYVLFHKRDCLVVKGLKSRLLRSCQAQLRPETILALGDRDPAVAARMDDALWRIWTFCTIFGCDSRQYNSLEDQVDWLHGGESSRQHVRHDSRLSYDNNTRARRPSPQITSDSFGRGNFGGLGVDELDDMLEIWDCFKDLLWGLTGPGCVAQAKIHGVFDAQGVVSGDGHTEQVILEEWAHWLATQGLSVIADLAADTKVRRTTAFITAKNMDWTTWDTPAPGQTRAGFLRQAIEQARESKLAPQAFSKFSEDMPISERRKSRGHELAAQLREKERGFDLKHATAQDDKENFFDLWLAWTNKAEAKTSTLQQPQSSQLPRLSQSPPSRLPRSPPPQRSPPPRKPLPTIPVQPLQPQRSPPTLPGSSTSPPAEKARPTPRPRSSNNSLSLFPPQYKSRMTPVTSARASPTSTPMRSRQNSISRESDSIEQLKIRALKQARLSQSEKGMFVDETFSPRLSVCREA